MPIHGYPGNVITANPTAPTVSSASGVWTTEQQLAAVAAGNWPFTIPPQQVGSSARFNSADTAYLSRTPTTASNRRTWTWSCWIKGSAPTSTMFSASNGSAGALYTRFGGNGGGIDIGQFNTGADFSLYTNAVTRDYSAWYHIVIAIDTTQATSTNRVKIYINAVEQTSLVGTYPTQNQDLFVNTTNAHAIGRFENVGQYLNGYLAEVNFIDGQALTPSSFGQTNIATGVWEPIAYSGSYGTNGFELPFTYNATGFSADFLVVAGGGSGGNGNASIRIYGGGGAGGYRTSAGPSGGGGSAESALSLAVGTAYTVTVGAGAAGQTTANTFGNKGSDSVFSTITSIGGGAGSTSDVPASSNGGSGGGGSEAGGFAYTGGAGTTGQGFAGGTYVGGGAGGGGGASAVGVNGAGGVGGNGGAGVASSITGSSVTRAGGGGGGGTSSGGSGGAGGGTAGNASTAAGANTGSGSGGTATNIGTGNGGSGVVIIKIPDTNTATFSGGVTSSLSTAVSGFKIYTVTATSTTSETVTFT